jgi:hypothetical protein
MKEMWMKKETFQVELESKQTGLMLSFVTEEKELGEDEECDRLFLPGDGLLEVSYFSTIGF